MIATAHIQIAAPALGSENTFTGSINTASQSCPPLVEALGMPDGQIPYATFLIGYPDRKIPPYSQKEASRCVLALRTVRKGGQL